MYKLHDLHASLPEISGMLAPTFNFEYEDVQKLKFLAIHAGMHYGSSLCCPLTV
jgi:hypothetical protein